MLNLPTKLRFLTFAGLQLYKAIMQCFACCFSSMLFWSAAYVNIFKIARSAGEVDTNCSEEQYVWASVVKNFTLACFVFTLGVWVESVRILKTLCSWRFAGKYSYMSVSVFQIFPCIDPSRSVPNLLNNLVRRMKSQSWRSCECDRISSLTVSRKSE